MGVDLLLLSEERALIWSDLFNIPTTFFLLGSCDFSTFIESWTKKNDFIGMYVTTILVHNTRTLGLNMQETTACDKAFGPI